jgi:F0F1-type ATP synthase assembly protein I
VAEPSNSRGDQRSESASEKRKYLIQAARYSQLAITLPAATFVGWLIGYGLDRWLHTHFLYLVGLLVGIAAGFVELIRTALSREAE